MGTLFGTDGIRGTVGEWPMVPDFILKIGQSAGKVLKSGRDQITIVVGRDTRFSGAMLQSALVSGLLASGVDVIDVDVIPTAGVAWLIRQVGAEAGAVISASHNPVEQNGVKFFNQGGKKLPAEMEDEIERLALSETETFVRQVGISQHLGRVIDDARLQELYARGLLAEHPPAALGGLKVLVDCANGAASHVAPRILERAGVQVFALNASPSGYNINDRAGSEYVRRFPGELGDLIRRFGVDFGLAFDGDADRVVFVDREGGLIDGDHMLGFLARYLDQKGLLLARSVVTTTMRNSGLKKYIEAHGMKMYETPVGDKYVVEKLDELRQQNPIPGQYGLGGEQAGHVVLLDDVFNTGDGIRTALFVMRAFLDSGAGSMQEFAAGIGKTPQIIASAYVANGPRLERDALAAMQEEIRSKNSGLERVNLRYSGTEPQFRVMLESDGSQSEETLAEIAFQLCRQVQEYAGIVSGPIDILNCSRGGVLFS